MKTATLQDDNLCRQQPFKTTIPEDSNLWRRHPLKTTTPEDENRWRRKLLAPKDSAGSRKTKTARQGGGGKERKDAGVWGRRQMGQETESVSRARSDRWGVWRYGNWPRLAVVPGGPSTSLGGRYHSQVGCLLSHFATQTTRVNVLEVKMIGTVTVISLLRLSDVFVSSRSGCCIRMSSVLLCIKHVLLASTIL